MKTFKTTMFWLLALVLTLVMAHYQRATGPTYPVDGEVTIAGRTIEYDLTRTHGGPGDQEIEIPAPDSFEGVLAWKRFGVDEPYTLTPMTRSPEGTLTAKLPHQPPAGKLAYHVFLRPEGEMEWTAIPGKRDVITRFKGEVPLWVLLPHILMMFTAMFLSTRAAIAAIAGERKRTIAWITLVCLVIGGMFLGPLVQKYAFNAYWTGWPFGEDYTDNKTAAAVLAWAIALWRLRGSNGEQRGRWWSLGAAVVLLGVYMIPHSLGGSSFDYKSGEIATGGGTVNVESHGGEPALPAVPLDSVLERMPLDTTEGSGE